MEIANERLCSNKQKQTKNKYIKISYKCRSGCNDDNAIVLMAW